MKTMATTEEVSSVGMEKREGRRNWRQIVPCAREKLLADLKKVLANLWSGKKMSKNRKKSPTLVVGQKPNGKSRDTCLCNGKVT